MFLKAKPIFAELSGEPMHVLAEFRATASDLTDAELRVCAADFYRVQVNGRFVAFGPARTAKGYARMDVLPLCAYGTEQENEIVISVLSHRCRSLSTVLQAPFLMAEVVRKDTVLLYTGRDFSCSLPASHIQKTERYSVQRHFSEIVDLRKTDALSLPIRILDEAPTVIPRRASYPSYAKISYDSAASVGTLEQDDTIVPQRSYYSFQPSERWGRFEYDEIDSHPFPWIQCQRQHMTAKNVSLPLTLHQGEYAIFDLSRIETGFLQLSATAENNADLVIAFSENSSPEQFFFTNMHVHNVLEVMLPAKAPVSFMSFEPYVLRYAVVAARSGSATLTGFGVTEYAANTETVTLPPIGDPVLRDICRAGVRTYAHNAVDLYTDCPSRERAGWLCDSYFTAKTEYALFGRSDVEDAFLENYRLFRNEDEYPDGVIPMCYPSDPQDSFKFIPQWTMWYILEVRDYVFNREKADQKELFRDSILGLLDFYARYENKDGLLEDLPSWNFVEWSVANEWTQNVNYPTNFLYAGVLEAVYEMYGDEQYLAKAQKVRETTIAQSFDGTLFYDHALRDENGVLVLQRDCSEACQYYAVLFGGFDLSEARFDSLRHMILKVFGADRDVLLDKIAPINAFIGAYLRLEVLLKMEEYDLLLQDVKGFFGGMASETGTLWEYRQNKGSRDHGFASYALVAIQKALSALA